ncbi:hypothetical protein MTO98_22205 [Mucilaginibacter sp. SMC90]|nr:hypothetical protein [Mucilaginibacter sp. SMC90]UOE47119.1 hypothetical protein MTO98_22205 [Mucilaginibacter sp. SMC90]
MTDLNDAFEKAVKESKELPSKPGNEILLCLYRLYSVESAAQLSYKTN